MNNLNYNVYMLDENLEDHEFILQFDNPPNPKDLQNLYGVNQIHQQSYHLLLMHFWLMRELKKSIIV